MHSCPLTHGVNSCFCTNAGTPRSCDMDSEACCELEPLLFTSPKTQSCSSLNSSVPALSVWWQLKFHIAENPWVTATLHSQLHFLTVNLCAHNPPLTITSQEGLLNLTTLGMSLNKPPHYLSIKWHKRQVSFPGGSKDEEGCSWPGGTYLGHPNVP